MVRGSVFSDHLHWVVERIIAPALQLV